MSRVSIIIPTHNRAALLPRAIESAKAAGTDVEVIVVDDASTDETGEICRRTAGIRYLRLDQNSKLARARNAGIEASSSEFVAFLDDDDLRLPGSIDQQLRLLSEHPEASFIYGRVQLVGADDNLPADRPHPPELFTGDVFWQLLEGNFIQVASVLVRRKCFVDIGLFDSTIDGVEDWDAWIRLSEKHQVLAVPEPVAIYRVASLASDQMSSNRLAMSRTSALVQARRLELPRALAQSKAYRKRIRRRYLDFVSRWLVVDARTELEHRNYPLALQYSLLSVRYSPLCLARTVFAGLRGRFSSFGQPETSEAGNQATGKQATR
jgi:glycosyltransferase involved in cell wall biosynthesis